MPHRRCLWISLQTPCVLQHTFHSIPSQTYCASPRSAPVLNAADHGLQKEEYFNTHMRVPLQRQITRAGG